MKRLSAVLAAGALLFAGCSSGGVIEEVSTSTLFPEVVETTIPPTTVPDSPSPTTIPLPPTTTPQGVEDSPSPEPTPVGHALSFAPENDSFSFENFGGGEAPADLTVNMARRLYGDDQVCSDVTDNKCTPYPVILQLMSQANKSMRGGLCEGLAVLSLRLAGDLETLASFQGTDTVAQLIKEDPALLSEIAYWYVTQFATEVQQEASSYLEMSPKELAEVLLYDFAESEAGNNHTGFTIGIYSSSGGHAVTPYRVSQTSTGYRIYIYDSNWPTAERWIDVDDDGWVYALAATNPTEEAEAWSGGTGTMELTPMSVRSGPFTCGFCPQEGTAKSGTLLTVAASGSKQMSLKIVTESGQRLGYYNEEGFVNEIPGATYRYLISGPSTSDPVLVFLPPEVETFTADVEEIEVPAPEADAETLTEDSGTDDPEVPPEQEQEEPTQQKFSLLVLNEEKSVQIEATIEEPTEEEVVEEEAQSLIAFSEESVEVAEIEEATVAIAVDALVVEVELDEGQQVEMVFAEEVSTTEPEMLELSIQDDQGEVLAEVDVDVSVYRVEEEPTPSPDEPDSPIPEAVPQPVQIEITYDEETAEVVQEEEEIEEWVASDAEYYQAVAEDRLDEVLGETYVEEIEEIDDWEPLETDNDFDLVEVILSVDAEYWEDEQWEEVDYDEEWFEAEEEEFLELFNEDIELEAVLEFVEATEVDEYWAAEEEQHILEEFGVEEWNEELMGPPPTETVDWEEEDWEAYDEEMDALWEEQMEDPDAWEEEILEELGVEEWDPEWGPSPTESAEWTEEDWDAYDAEMEAQWEEEESWEPEEEWTGEDEESLILEEEGLEEWPEDWGPSPSETGDWTEEDWNAYDTEEAEEAFLEELSELTDEELDEWNEFVIEELEEAGEWTAEDEEAWILEQEGLEEWPEDWGPSPSESWEWTDEDWQEYDESMGHDDGLEWEEPELEEEWEEDEEAPEDEEWDEGWEESPPETEEDSATEPVEEEPESEDDTSTAEWEDLPEEDPAEWDDPAEWEDSTDEDWAEDESDSETPDDWTDTGEEEEVLAEEDWVNPYEDCIGTSACESAPAGYDDWDDYEEQNDPDYDPYEDWGEPPAGYANWDDFEMEAAAGIVGGDTIEEYVPEAELEEFIEEVIPEPEPVVYTPTITYSSSTQDTLEIVSQATVTALTSQLVEAETTSILALGTDGNWYSTATTVTETTNSYVDTTTVVTRTQSDTTTCTFYDGTQNGCSTTTAYSDSATTVLVGEAYGPGTQAVTTVADPVPESCDQGGWTGMGDWCIVQSSGRNDRETVGFVIPGTTGTDPPVQIRIDAESNLTYAGWGQGNNHDDEHGDPYIFLFQDNDTDVGEHSGDTSEITIGVMVASNDDGGRDCDDNGGWQACLNPPSDATDPDETPNVTMSDGTAVINNIVDAWDSRIDRALNPGHYAVQGATYNTATGGWYRLTIREEE